MSTIKYKKKEKIHKNAILNECYANAFVLNQPQKIFILYGIHSVFVL